MNKNTLYVFWQVVILKIYIYYRIYYQLGNIVSVIFALNNVVKFIQRGKITFIYPIIGTKNLISSNIYI